MSIKSSMSIVGTFRKFMELNKLAIRCTINSNEIVFNIIKNEILKRLGKQERPIKVIVKNGKQYININLLEPFSIYYILKALDAGWTITDSSEKITVCYQSEKPLH